MGTTDLPISITTKVSKIGSQFFYENLKFSQKNVKTWWDKDATRDAIKSAAGVDKSFAKTPFVKLPNLPKKFEIKNKIILDLGCGYGRTLIPLAKLQPKLAIGIDISSVMLSKCIDYANANGVELFLVRSEFPPIPLKNCSVDLIYSCAVLLHLDKNQIQPLLQEMTRVLKPGGKVILQSCFPNAFNLKGLSNWLPALLKSKLTGRKIIPGMPKHYSVMELKKILNTINLKYVVKPQGYELIPTNINRYSIPFQKQIKKINAWVESKVAGKKNSIIDLVLPTFFDIEFK